MKAIILNEDEINCPEHITSIELSMGFAWGRSTELPLIKEQRNKGGKLQQVKLKKIIIEYIEEDYKED